jgi:hypothetical protein
MAEGKTSALKKYRSCYCTLYPSSLRVDSGGFLVLNLINPIFISHQEKGKYPLSQGGLDSRISGSFWILKVKIPQSKICGYALANLIFKAYVHSK